MSKCFRCLPWILLLGGVALGSGCKGTGSSTPGDSTPAKPAPSQAKPADSTPAQNVAAVDACTLVTQAEVEAAIGRSVLAPEKEEVPQFSVCVYGDPGSPQIKGHAMSHLVKISVMVGDEGAYYAGAAAQAKDSFELFEKNAASPQAVAGLGDDAYWDDTFQSLNVLDGTHLVEVEILSDAGGLDVAKALMTKVLAKLP